MKLNERTLIAFASDRSTSDKEGFLMKKGEVNRQFQRRYFVLCGNMLFYYEKKLDKEPVGVIILENCHVELSSSEAFMFAFQIIFDGSGARRYVLAADDQDEMVKWMKRITHAGYIHMKTIVEDLERRLDGLKRNESQMAQQSDSNELVNSISSDSDTEINEIPTEVVPEPLPKPFSRLKSKTLPPKKFGKKDRVLEDAGRERWSFVANSVPQSSQFLGPDQCELQDLIDFSDRTDFLFSDSRSSRHFSINDFTPPSFSELKKHEEIADQNLIDIECGFDNDTMHKTHLSNSLANRIKGNRRAKSERRRPPISSPRKDLFITNRGGSLSRLRRIPQDSSGAFADDSGVIAGDYGDSQFQYLHKLWGAAIWVKVRAYEDQNEKAADCRL